MDLNHLATQIKSWGQALGFAHVGISDIDLTQAETYLAQWLADGLHGDLDYMHKHGTRRTRPQELVPGTLRVISVQMDYFPEAAADAWHIINDSDRAYIARYALGRDYHKTLRQRLHKLAQHIETEIGPRGYRVFVDSAPVMERALGEKAGSGWIGKHTNLINKQRGSWFFLGEIYVDIALPPDAPARNHCGSCTRCIDICPTQAIIAPYRLDARRCIAYLTIENKGAIPMEFRAAIGNRIFGCDDCQLVCPWNRFATPTRERDFAPRHGLDHVRLIELFAWTETEFLAYTEGSPLRRVGYIGWLRNLAVALGNASPHADALTLLNQRLPTSTPMLAEHIHWALQKLTNPRPASSVK
ncbi:MAG: tRNA epoxyqueuosine(34) reductase QueG [Gammaproteobacteria bacterium]|nr:tRNA epoxyqueuosine(34) reductase QueG [Gammaproteobacteria bacterium]